MRSAGSCGRSAPVRRSTVPFWTLNNHGSALRAPYSINRACFVSFNPAAMVRSFSDCTAHFSRASAWVISALRRSSSASSAARRARAADSRAMRRESPPTKPVAMEPSLVGSGRQNLPVHRIQPSPSAYHIPAW